MVIYITTNREEGLWGLKTSHKSKTFTGISYYLGTCNSGTTNCDGLFQCTELCMYNPLHLLSSFWPHEQAFPAATIQLLQAILHTHWKNSDDTHFPKSLSRASDIEFPMCCLTCCTGLRLHLIQMNLCNMYFLVLNIIFHLFDTFSFLQWLSFC